MTPETPPGTRLILASEEWLELFSARNNSGRLITAEWGEQEPEGWYTPVLTSHDDGMVIVPAEQAALGQAWARAEAALPEGWYLRGLRRRYIGEHGQGRGWSATAIRGGLATETRARGTVANCTGFGPTPAAALDALAAALEARREVRYG